jgi:hypothetical protein
VRQERYAGSAMNPPRLRRVTSRPLELAGAIGSARSEAPALAGLGRCTATDGHTARVKAPVPERMFCAHGLTYAYCFSRHS